ncbi:MAG: TVP38/TMEM64 family protein [Clostridia bacterium]|nr:TVP38/TMEM64 family protein [Clostridia bacterium]
MKKVFHEKELGSVKHYSRRVATGVLTLISVASVVFAVLGFFWIRAKFGDTNLIREWAIDHPILAALSMVIVTAVQVVIALIPGELVEVAAGYVFGAWLGALLCLVGMAIGSIVAILLARRFGRRLVASLYSEEKLDSLPLLNDPKKRNAATAILFLIPGTPKDLLTYLVGLTGMSIPQYLALTLVCRFPSVIMSTLSGDALGDDRLVRALWFFVITGILSAGGYLIYLAIQKRQGKK